MSKKKSAKKRGFKKIKKDGSRVEVDRRRRRRTRPNKRKPRKGGPKKAAVRTKTAAKKKPLRKKRASPRSSSAGRKARQPRRLKKVAKKGTEVHERPRVAGVLRRTAAVKRRAATAHRKTANHKKTSSHHYQGPRRSRQGNGWSVHKDQLEVTGAGHHPGGVEDPYFDRRSDDELARDAGYRDAEHMVQAVNEFQEELDAAEAMNDGGVGEKYTHAEGPDPEQPDAEFVGELEDIDIL